MVDIPIWFAYKTLGIQTNEEVVLIYKVLFKKNKTYWWDEEALGWCTFRAESDEVARQIVTTIALRMNRKYWRIDEPRGVEVVRLERIDDADPMEVQLDISHLQPLREWRAVRRALEMFYPRMKDNPVRRRALIPLFDHWKPRQNPIWH